MFIPVVDARALIGESLIEGGATSVILLNRYYLRGVEQMDSRSGERAEPLSG